MWRLATGYCLCDHSKRGISNKVTNRHTQAKYREAFDLIQRRKLFRAKILIFDCLNFFFNFFEKKKMYYFSFICFFLFHYKNKLPNLTQQN